MRAVTPSLIHHSLGFMHLLACPYHCDRAFWSKTQYSACRSILLSRLWVTRHARSHYLPKQYMLTGTLLFHPDSAKKCHGGLYGMSWVFFFDISFILHAGAILLFLVSTTFSLAFVSLSCLLLAGAVSIFSFFSLLLLLHFYYNLGSAHCTYCTFNPFSLHLCVLSILDRTCYYFFKYLTVA